MQTEMIAPAASLPTGYSARPAELADAAAATAMFNAASQAVLGVDQHKVADTEREWQSPEFNLATDSCLLLAPDGAVAGFANLWDGAPHVQPEQWGRVHPAHAGRGLGTYLMAWAEARAQPVLALAPAGARVILNDWINSRDTATHALLRDWGHAHVRTAWRMIIDFRAPTPVPHSVRVQAGLPTGNDVGRWQADAPPPTPVWPPGVSVRTFVLGQDDEAAVHTVRAAFADHWGHVTRPFEEEMEGWRHNWQHNPSFDASLWSLAVTTDAQGEHIIGTSFARMDMPEDPAMGWIFSLGVRREWRRQGLALALLHDSFGRLYARGRRRVGLGVDAGSLTGATRLYEKAGMRPDPNYTYQVWEKELRAGADLATTALDAH